MLRYALALLSVLAASASAADVVSHAPESVEVTIYRDQPGLTSDIAGADASLSGLAMITEMRTIDLPAGVSTIKFRGVADAIVPQTAKFESLPAPIVESNFDYDLITPGNLIAKSIGKRVRIVRTDTHSGKVTEHHATLRSGLSGVLLDIDGKIEALGCSGLDERIVFDEVPSTLSEQPTLSVVVRATESGRYQLRLSYLVLGMNWSADYVAHIRSDGKTLDLSAWITLVNRLSTSFDNAPVHVVAGTLSRVEDETIPPVIETVQEQSRCWPIGSFVTAVRGKSYRAPMEFQARLDRGMAVLQEVAVTAQMRAAISELGDYKLYTLPEPTTVASQQTKQIQFLDQRKVSFERVYTHRLYPDSFPKTEGVQQLTVTLRLQNKAKDGLGKPLPAGTVSVIEPGMRSTLILAGEHTIRDIPVGSPAELEIGQAMDVWIKPRVVSDVKIGTNDANGRRLEIEVSIGNDKPVAIRLELLHEKYDGQALNIVSESKRHGEKFGAPLWSYTLKPGAHEILRYTVEETY